MLVAIMLFVVNVYYTSDSIFFVIILRSESSQNAFYKAAVIGIAPETC